MIVGTLDEIVTNQVAVWTVVMFGIGTLAVVAVSIVAGARHGLMRGFTFAIGGFILLGILAAGAIIQNEAKDTVTTGGTKTTVPAQQGGAGAAGE